MADVLDVDPNWILNTMYSTCNEIDSIFFIKWKRCLLQSLFIMSLNVSLDELEEDDLGPYNNYPRTEDLKCM